MAFKVMTDAQRIAFETNGFLVIENALPSEELSRVRAEAEQAERLWDENPSLPGFRKPELSELIAPIEYGPAMRDLLWHPRTFPIVREILGNDVSMIDNSYYITPPHTLHTHADWHHDVGVPGVAVAPAGAGGGGAAASGSGGPMIVTGGPVSDMLLCVPM